MAPTNLALLMAAFLAPAHGLSAVLSAPRSAVVASPRSQPVMVGESSFAADGILFFGIGIIIMQDVATKLATHPRVTFDDIHFGFGADAPSVDDVMYAQVAELLEGDGMPSPDTRSRIEEAYGEVAEPIARKNTKEL